MQCKFKNQEERERLFKNEYMYLLQRCAFNERKFQSISSDYNDMYSCVYGPKIYTKHFIVCASQTPKFILHLTESKSSSTLNTTQRDYTHNVYIYHKHYCVQLIREEVISLVYRKTVSIVE